MHKVNVAEVFATCLLVSVYSDSKTIFSSPFDTASGVCMQYTHTFSSIHVFMHTNLFFTNTRHTMRQAEEPREAVHRGV